MREINEIIIHCSATPNGRDIRVADIDRWHKQRRWRGIGYHFVIEVGGHADKGRDIDIVGAHCREHNENSVGVCMIGMDSFYKDQWYKLRGIVRVLQAQHEKIDKINGHNHYNQHKTCPGFSVRDWLRGDMQPMSGHIMKPSMI